MKRWIIHMVYVAKDTNPNFAGEVHHLWYGKQDELLHNIDNVNLGVSDLSPYLIHEYGFKSKGGASKALSAYKAYRNANPEKFWDVPVMELKEVEI